VRPGTAGVGRPYYPTYSVAAGSGSEGKAVNTLVRRPAFWIGVAWLVAIGLVAVRVATSTPLVAETTPIPSEARESASSSGSIGLSSPTATPTTEPTPTPSPTATASPMPTLAPTAAPTARPATPAPPTQPPAVAATAVLVGAGDIATCGGSGDEATAALLDSIAGTVFTAGDNVYSDGTAAEFADCFNPSWGRHKARTFPAPGNHDYHVAGAAGYYGYFGNRAGGPGGYYAYNLGAWRVYSLNSEIVGDAQVNWLRADLAANPRACVVAYWHHPLFSSGRHGNDDAVRPFWDVLHAAGAELVINGHDHDYERFGPQAPDGGANANGIREIVVGTGGAGLRPFEGVRPNSEVRDFSTNGVLKLTLNASGYRWDFVPAGGSFRDSGTGTCH